MARREQVICYADTDLVHAAYATTGLIELADAGQIDLHFALCRESMRRCRGPFTLLLSINDASLVCIDFHDSNTYYCRTSLDLCDRYYKANWPQGGMQELSETQRSKIYPFGPYLPCRPSRDQSVGLRTLGNALTHVRHRLSNLSNSGGGTKLLRQVKHGWLTRINRYRSRMKGKDYERTPVNQLSAEPSPMVFFNPTCWREETPADEAMNQLRSRLIVGLRAELGDRFAGGLRRNGLAEQKYPTALEDQHYSHAEYLQLLHTAPISIYTNGLSGCFSWRLLETLAGSKAIVSEELRNDPGFPLSEEQGFLPCADATTMIEAAVALTGDHERREAMQRASWETYTRQMRPSARMRALLDEIINAESAAQSQVTLAAST